MTRNEDIQLQLALGEDGRWEFKEASFVRDGNRLSSSMEKQFASAMIAFANSNGGRLLVGVRDDGSLQGLSRKRMDAVVDSLSAIGRDGVKPALRFDVQRRLLDGKAFVLVEVPRGDTLHEYKGETWERAGASNRRLTGDEPMRLAQRRGQGRRLGFDQQTVSGTGFDTLTPGIWMAVLSAEGLRAPESALEKMGLLARDASGVRCATVAGLLLCTRNPEEWVPSAVLTATHYRGLDRASGQVDAQEIRGPLQRQIEEAVGFVRRNMRVAARKMPNRIDMPQYSEKAVFEAVVNAVAHRDYSVRGSRIRLSMFSDRLEIQSPGALPNGVTIDNMRSRQSTRNEVVASVLGRMGVGDVGGSSDRRFFMERRGDGVPVIFRETRELAGRSPKYRLIDGADVLLRIPAAPQDATAVRAVVAVRSAGRPVEGADVLALFPNGTSKRAVSNQHGEATLDLYTAALPMTVFGAALGYGAGVTRDWLPSACALELDLPPLPRGGSAVFTEGTGRLPGLSGTLNPVRDTQDRTYLYTHNVAVGQGRPQPVLFAPSETELRLTDAEGVVRIARIVEIVGRSALVEYWAPDE